MKARPLRLGLLGTGVAARKLYLPAFGAIEGRVEVSACASRARHSAEEFARLAGVPRVVTTAAELFSLPDIDAVFISLPIHLQPAFVLEAFAAGKAVLSEKPVAPSVESGRELLAAASAFDVPWLVGENYAFTAGARALRHWVSSGRLGEVRLVEVRQVVFMDRANPYFNTAWRARPVHVGGFVVDGGVHLANVVRRCFGMPTVIRGLTAQLEATLPPVDTAVAALRFASGALGTWTSCFAARHDGAALVRVLGSQAFAELFPDRAVLGDGRGATLEEVPSGNGIAEELIHFADVVLDGAPPEVTPREALSDLELICRLIGSES